MADNILRAVITADAPGVKETFDGIGESVKKTGESFQKAGHTITSSSQQARFAVVDIGHALRDLPFALQNPILLSGPIDHLTQALTTLKQTSGTTGGAIQALKDSLTGGGGLMIGITLVTTVLTLLSRNLFDSKKVVDDNKVAIEALDHQLKLAKASLDDFNKGIEFLQKLGKVDLDIKFGKGFKADLLDLQGKMVDLSRQLVDAEEREQDGIKQVAAIRKKAIEDGVDADEKAIAKIQEAQLQANKDVKDIWQKRVVLAREIDALRINDARKTEKELQEEADKAFDKEEAKRKSRLAKELSEATRFAKERAKIMHTHVDFLDPKELAEELKKEAEKALKESKFELDISKHIIPIGTAATNIRNAIDIHINHLRLIHKEAVEIADKISGVVTPAFENMFSAIISGENPIKAFFKSVEQGIFQLISDLITAAIKAAILKIVLGVVTGGAGGAVGNIGNVWSGTWGGTMNPTNLRGISGSLGGSLQLSGVLRGNDIYVSSQRAAASLGRQG